jgi:hypothetical protein
VPRVTILERFRNSRSDPTQRPGNSRVWKFEI